MAERITSSSNDNFFEKNLFTAIEKRNKELVDKLIKCGADINSTDEYGITPLIYAACKENEKMVENLIECGADINATNKYGRTVLFYAVGKENETIVETLIKSGADFNAKDKEGLPVLFYAVVEGNEKIVQKLIEWGTDVNATAEDGATALFYTAKEEVAEKLIECGADINAKDEDGLTVLFYAVDKENEKMFDKLIECGVDINATEKEGVTPLFHAVLEDNEEMVDKLIECGADVNATENQGLTALLCAVKEEKEGMVEKLIQCGADINANHEHGLTPLFYAVRKENEKLINKLIKCGADINAKNEHSLTPLFYAAEKENEKIVDKLIESGADINTKDEYAGQTPLFYAARRENKEMVKKLIDLGADINATDKYGRTVLFYAVGKENKKMIEKLIECGADINTKDKDSKTALFYAAKKENENILATLIECGADISANEKYGMIFFMYALLKEDEKMIKKLLECGADVNATNKYGRTVLFYAVGKENEIIVETLIKSGADINTKDEDGATALFYAVRKENEKIVEKLIECGADVNATDEDGATALFYAAKEEVAEKLIDCGADINATNKDGRSALVHALMKTNEEMVEKLIRCGADINAKDEYGLTVLFYAVREENEKIVQKLIECGADINAKNEHGLTPLFYAVHKENEIIINKLIQCGADINAREKYGQTVLFYAVKEEKEGMAKKLIDLGADINATDEDGQIALFYAMTHSLSLARYLLDKGATLHFNDNCSVLTFFIEKCIIGLSGKTPNLQDGLNLLNERKGVERKTIFEAIVSVAFYKHLHFKPGSGDIDVDSLCVLMRLAKENTSGFKFFEVMFPVGKSKTISDISTIIQKERHDEHLIESSDALELPRLLIKLGANPNTTDSDGNTALHHATQLAFHGVTQESIMEICQQLHKLNVSYHITNHQNETPLLYCLTRTIEKVSKEKEPWPALKTQAAVCRFLVEHGSSVEAKTGTGETVLHLTIKLLQQGFYKRNSELTKDLVNVALELLKVIALAFRKQDVSINIQDNIGNTPLHLWAKLELTNEYHSSTATDRFTFKRLLKMILDHFRESRTLLHVKNKEGETPLHLCKTWSAVELLLDAGANPNDVDSSGRTPLLLAARNNESVHNQGLLYPDILMDPDTFWRTVLKEGLNPWIVDRQGESVLSVLIKSKSNDLARALVDVACHQDTPAYPLVLFCLLNTICRDKLPNAQWKKDAAEMILSLTKCPVNGNDNEDSPLHYCCRNIVEASKSLSNDEIKMTVHWCMVKLLRSFGADYRIPDATNKSCLDIAEECPALKELLMEPIDLDKFQKNIKIWISVSKSHERYLQKVVRHLESKHVKSYWYHKDHLACGSFGAVFAGINEKDGREVAIKRIEKIRMQRPEDKREITNLTALADCEQVVRYLLFFEDENFSYIVLELMEGNLDGLLQHAIAVNIRVKLCEDVVKGLKFLHDHSILHRDVKPTNILYKYKPNLCLKIADFGLSRRIDSTSTTVYGTNAGTRCWIAPEVLTSTKPHSKSSDMFACGLVLHYILSVKTHPFAPRTGAPQHEIETNIAKGNMEGWDDSLCPEPACLLKAMLDGDKSKRTAADKALDHPFFWSKKKKLDLLVAVGNEREFECPRAKRTLPLTPLETDLEKSFGVIVKHVNWNDARYVHMPAIYSKMKKKRKYKTNSVVELVRFIRNAHVHVNELPKPIQKLLQEDFVFLEYFPNLVMEVYKAVTTHGWDQTRQEINNKMNK